MALGRFVLSRGYISKKKFGRFSFGLAPLNPYYPKDNFLFFKHDLQNIKAESIIELPNSTIPMIRFPFHSTFIFMFGLRLFNWGIKLWDKSIPLNYAFHAIDLLPDNIEKQLVMNPTLSLSEKQRIRTVEHILERIVSKWDIIPSKNLALQMRHLLQTKKS
jgi:hypothetical protein